MLGVTHRGRKRFRTDGLRAAVQYLWQKELGPLYQEFGNERYALSLEQVALHQNVQQGTMGVSGLGPLKSRRGQSAIGLARKKRFRPVISVAFR